MRKTHKLLLEIDIRDHEALKALAEKINADGENFGTVTVTSLVRQAIKHSLGRERYKIPKHWLASGFPHIEVARSM